jgi:glycosyltransferase involved in cell wall biosynthesis
VVIRLTEEHPAGATGAAASLAAVLRGRAVPETMAWHAGSVRERLLALHCDAIICVSARAYHPALLGSAPAVVLDYVDALSRSYGDRARLAETLRARAAYTALARAHRRFERRSIAEVRRVAAGHADAERLGAGWVPIVASTSTPVDAAPDVDVVFVGTLRYPPNVAAIRRLARLWPEVQRRRPGTTAMVAGAAPVAEVVALCSSRGWTLLADFGDASAVYGRARVAVAPLDHTAGIQIKVLDAAVLGVPQVVSPAALEGLAPGFPVCVAATDGEFVAALLALLDDETRRLEVAAAAARHVSGGYTAAVWAPVVAELVGLPLRAG